MQNFIQNIRRFLSRLTVGQQAALGLVLAGGTAIIISISYWANQPDYTLLFGELDPTDANQVVESLREEDIPYQLKNGGTAVYVPRGDVYELRLRFASEGTISKGQVGYELFDRDNLGMTDFMQKMNKKRALEGELARTVTNIRQVEMARVHLVLPERSPFRDASVEATASVVIQPAGSNSLTTRQIEGITALVAGAVEGMSPNAVTVIDAQGNMLSDPNAGDPTASLTSTQLEIQREVEQHLTKNGQSMLDQMLGSGEAIVRVSANLDFSQTVSEREIIDPESRTIISEEKLNEEGPEDNANSTVRNYELSRTQERFESSVGDISYLTVSVMLNHKKGAAEGENGEQNGEQPAERTPYSDEELQEIESIVKNAVGFDPERGDRFAIHQTRFDTSVDDQIVSEMQEQDWQRQMELYVRYGLILIALLLGAWIVRSMAKRGAEMADVGGELMPAPSGGSGGRRLQRQQGGQQGSSGSSGLPTGDFDDEEIEDMALVDDVYTSKLSAQAKAKLKAKNQMYEEIHEQVTNNPDETAELIRSWLVADANQMR